MTEMRLDELFFAQDSVNGIFKETKTSLIKTFDDLLYDRISVESFPPLTVVQYDGKFYAYDGNRRLYLFKVSYYSSTLPPPPHPTSF